MSSNGKAFINGLSEDPTEKALLAFLYRTQKNKLKISYAAKKLTHHSRTSLVKTLEFLEQPNLILKSFQPMVIKKLRYLEPSAYDQWILDMIEHYDYVMGLRSQFRPMQTYKAIGDLISGLSQFNSPLTATQKQCILAASYVIFGSGDDTLVNEAFEYNWQDHFVRLHDGEMVDYITDHPEEASNIREAITACRVYRVAEIQAALAGGTTTLLKGSL